MDISIIKHTPLFKGMTEGELLPFVLSPRHALKSFDEGEYIARQGDPCRSLLLLCSGIVRAQMVNDDGKQFTVSTLSAPLLLAPAFVFSALNRFPANIVALDSCEILAMNKDVFIDFIRQYPTAMTNFLELVSNRVVLLSKKLNEFALQSLKTRLVNYLRIHHALGSHSELAQIMGVARPSLSRAIAELIADGSITLHGKQVDVANPAT